jgi:hypothetical protein
MHRLSIRQIGMHPKPISPLQIGNFGDGKRMPGALYADADLRSVQYKSGGIGSQIRQAENHGR